MGIDSRAALLVLIRTRLAEANRLMPVVQQARFPGFRYPPMLWHWDDAWDEMSIVELMDVCDWINGIVGRLESGR